MRDQAANGCVSIACTWAGVAFVDHKVVVTHTHIHQRHGESGAIGKARGWVTVPALPVVLVDEDVGLRVERHGLLGNGGLDRHSHAVDHAALWVGGERHRHLFENECKKNAGNWTSTLKWSAPAHLFVFIDLNVFAHGLNDALLHKVEVFRGHGCTLRHEDHAEAVDHAILLALRWEEDGPGPLALVPKGGEAAELVVASGGHVVEAVRWHQ